MKSKTQLSLLEMKHTLYSKVLLNTQSMNFRSTFILKLDFVKWFNKEINITLRYQAVPTDFRDYYFKCPVSCPNSNLLYTNR